MEKKIIKPKNVVEKQGANARQAAVAPAASSAQAAQPQTPAESADNVLHEIPAAIQDAVAAEAITGKKKGESLRLFEEGRAYKTYFTRKFLERKSWKAPDPCQVLSHIPGSVIEIFVKPGQSVKKGQKMMIYEAMKMKNIVNSPMDGIVKEINAQVGDHLPKGALLFTFKKGAKKDK